MLASSKNVKTCHQQQRLIAFGTTDMLYDDIDSPKHAMKADPRVFSLSTYFGSVSETLPYSYCYSSVPEATILRM